MEIDPWASKGIKNYDEICEKFGLEKIDHTTLPEPTHLHRRGIIFAHRDLDSILSARKAGKPFGVLSGLMPSGQMHLGHKMVIDQARWFQDLGGDVTIAVADLEAHATRGLSLEKCRKYAIEEYISNYAGMGLNPDKTSIYFQSERAIVQKMGFTLGTKTNLSEMEAIYGFSGKTSLAHVQSPLVQAGDIVHPQLEEYGGLRPIVVPVGMDQDPHIRLTRGMVSKTNWFNVNKNKLGNLTIGLSIQDNNQDIMGMKNDGGVDKTQRKIVIDRAISAINKAGYTQINSNPKHGTIDIKDATAENYSEIQYELLSLERQLGGMGLMQPSSTYHQFAVGMTGGKMSSSMPETTIFLNDSMKTIEKKIKSSFSGGQPTVEEHRKKGGNPDIDVAYQYLRYFFEENDNELEKIREEYVSGKLLTGEIKSICVEKAESWMKEHHELKEQNQHLIKGFLS
ncbi:MAG: tryptophan--tRNA ligase [Marine Group III euryarchaeote CG-Epi1]|uniref:Tryptophan--tRNA ligase n=1 Tax=Marine Group III euryarchaeote CG-Epi1 TaxID=1888995 RepID=A0A1J5TVI1_9ARCH|nr:MAG: tryptophan--tRNA ligase [Marine Group III euryarchaeote CG-Epi1]|tara:strand:+ start:2296 stop:3654 length:1359 start_codon:yes stop_codon:yes gene_type:complete